MAEHLFNAKDETWVKLCYEFYKAPYPMFSISHWNIELFKENGRTYETIYIGNGLNFEQFTPELIPQEQKESLIVVEGWGDRQPHKDKNMYSIAVAQILKKQGARVAAISRTPISQSKHIPDEIYIAPTTEQMAALYKRARMLIKATAYDARSCSPIEAGSKGVVTIRGIDKGDDDLINGENCLKSKYDYPAIKKNALKAWNDIDLCNELATNMHKHILEFCNWDKWVKVMVERF
jgi:hypothetical protein